MKHSSLHYKPGIIFSFQLLRWRIEDIAFYLLYTNVIFLGYGVFCLVVRWRLKIMMHCWGMWQNDISSWVFILCPRVNILCPNCVQTVKCGYSNEIGAVWGRGRRWSSQPGQFLRILCQPVAIRDGSKVPRMAPKNISCRFARHGVSIMGVGVYKVVFGILGVKARVVGSITIFHRAEFCRCG